MRQGAQLQDLSYRNIIFNALPRALREPLRAHAIHKQVSWVHPQLRASLKIRRRFDDDGSCPDELNDYLKKSMMQWTLPGFLHYEDRNSMAFGVETRLPFLDYRLVEALFRIPSDAKLAGGQLKRILRDATRGAVPAPIVDRFKKQGYPAPLAQWLRELKPEFKERAHSAAAKECPVLNYPVWIKAVDQFLDDPSGAASRAPLEPVWRGLIAMLWHERFLGSAEVSA
jgi:asparagine synthase (glutamine-hydrolysing)